MNTMRLMGVTVLLAAGLNVAAAPERPNIVVFLVDDMGWQDTSVPFHTERTKLNQQYRTPHMERLAADGLLFAQAYASALCSPTRVSLLTGMNAARHRVTNWTKEKDRSPDPRHPRITPPDWNLNGICTNAGVPRTYQVTPLPALLREAGYRTIHVGKAHFGARGTPGEDPRQLGFDVNIGGHAPGGPGSYWGEKNFSAAWRTKPPDHSWDVPGLEAYHGQNINLTEVLTREAVRQVERAVAERTPFYLYLSHYAVHAPFEKDARFYQTYKDAGLGEHQAVYASMLASMDQSLGDLRAALKRLGVDGRTVLLFASDNGSPSQNPRNLPLRGHKISPYEGGTRVPMLACWPGVTAAGTRCDQPVLIEDFFPTVLELAGVGADGRVRQPVDGRSFVPLLRGQPADPAPRPLVWHFPHVYDQPPYSSVRVGDWKLIYQHASRRREIYHLGEDLGETRDRAAAEPQRLRELSATLGALLRERGALMPTDQQTGRPVEWPDQLPDQGAVRPAAADKAPSVSESSR